MTRRYYTGPERLAALRILAAPCFADHPAIVADDNGTHLVVTTEDGWLWSSGEQVLVDLLATIESGGGVGVGILESSHLDRPSWDAVVDALALLRRPVAS